MSKPEISLVVPLYNEEQVFDKLITRLNTLLSAVPYTLEIVLVNDGSRDNTPLLIRKIAIENPAYKAVFLSRNYGHQIAVSAGMASVSCTEAVMILDGDLQDPPELLETFYNKLKEGYEVVYAIRQKRKEGWVKKIAYWSFYRLLRSISEFKFPLDSGDFCMISRRVNDVIVAMPERSRYLRGIRTWIGFKQIGIPYERDAREDGEPKYNFKMLFQLAYDGIFNFSNIPLTFITKLGVVAFSIALIYMVYLLVLKLNNVDIPQGFTTTIFTIVLFSGVQLISLGVIGEYLARIYEQVKERPLFIISSVIENQEEKKTNSNS